MKKTLVAGWFSFEHGHFTAGDLLARDLVCEWLAGAGYAHEVALAPPLRGGVDLSSVDPHQYSQLVFVCGPFGQGALEALLLSRFGHCRLLGVNLSMLLPLDVWNPFDQLIERDSSARTNSDVVFLSRQRLVPLVGICRVETYEGALVEIADDAITRLGASREMALVNIDTRLDVNSTGLRTPSEIETLIARMDVVVTTRLHGTVLALKNGVPAIAIDPMAGGAKIRLQAEQIGWPVVFNVDALTDRALEEALSYCLTDAARRKAKVCAERAMEMARAVADEFASMLSHSEPMDRKYLARIAAPADNGWMLALREPGSAKLRSDYIAPRGKWIRQRVSGFLRLLSGKPG